MPPLAGGRKTFEPHRSPKWHDAPHRLLRVAGFRVGRDNRRANRRPESAPRAVTPLSPPIISTRDEQFSFSATDKLLAAAARRRSIEEASSTRRTVSLRPNTPFGSSGDAKLNATFYLKFSGQTQPDGSPGVQIRSLFGKIACGIFGRAANLTDDFAAELFRSSRKLRREADDYHPTRLRDSAEVRVK